MAANGKGHERRPADEPTTAAQYAALRTEIVTTLGITVGAFNQAIGDAHGGRSWRAIGEAITTWLQNQAKAQ